VCDQKTAECQQQLDKHRGDSGAKHHVPQPQPFGSGDTERIADYQRQYADTGQVY